MKHEANFSLFCFSAMARSYRLFAVVLFSCSLFPVSSPAQSLHCYFNHLCTCKLATTSTTVSPTPKDSVRLSAVQTPHDIRDISCLGVPFGSIPGTGYSAVAHCDVKTRRERFSQTLHKFRIIFKNFDVRTLL